MAPCVYGNERSRLTCCSDPSPRSRSSKSYPEDKYLPSFLVRGECEGSVFHAQIATDVEGDNVRIVTIYVPGPE